MLKIRSDPYATVAPHQKGGRRHRAQPSNYKEHLQIIYVNNILNQLNNIFANSIEKHTLIIYTQINNNNTRNRVCTPSPCGVGRTNPF